MRRHLFPSTFLLIAICLFQACTISSSGKSNKAKEIFFADPTIFSENGTYYLTGTRNIKPLGFTILKSKNLKTWTLSSSVPEKMILKEGTNTYGSRGFWAPQILKENGQYYLTYTANEQLVLASSNEINGLYTQDLIEPIDASEKNIDSFIFKDDDGKYYLYHVRFNNGNYLWVAEFDMSTGKINQESLTLCFKETQPWETSPVYNSDPIMEGPTVWKMEGKYYMLYSANHFKSIDYGVGYAVSDSPFGPWKKSPTNPIIHRSTVGENGAGHGDMFFDKDNKPYYVYHVHNSESKIARRRTRIVPLIFEKNLETGLYDISADGDAVIVPRMN